MKSKNTGVGCWVLGVRFLFYWFFLTPITWYLTPLLHAQTPALTAVKDTVYKSDGSLASGTVVITWRPFVTADSKPVFGGTKTVPLSNGALAVALVPNQGGTPSGTSYTVKYYQSGNVFSEETWVVPSSSALPSPGAPTVSNAGTPGSTTYYYWVSAKNANGETLLGPSGMTTTANSTLDGTNYNQISWNAVSGATSYRVWRTTTTTPPSGTGTYLVGETTEISINDQSNSLQQATTPSLNDTDPRTLADVRVTAAPSPTVTLAASQVNGTAIVSNPSATQTINAPQKDGVIPLQIKGASQDNSNILEIYDSQSSPVLQSYFNPQGAFVSHQPITNDHAVSGQSDFKMFVGENYSTFTPNTQSYIDENASVIGLRKTGTSPKLGSLLAVMEDTTTAWGYGFTAHFEDRHTSGTKTASWGMVGDVDLEPGSGATTAQGAGILATAYTLAAAGTITNMASIVAGTNGNWTGETNKVVNNYGLLVQDQAGVGTNNWAIKTGAGKVQFGDDVVAPTINSIRYADQFAGADAGAKIAAAIADLPSTGGTVDARGLEGAQSLGALAIDKPVVLLLGAGTYSFTSLSITVYAQIIGLGDQTVLAYTPTTGTAVTFNYPTSGNKYGAGLYNLNLDGPGSATSTTGLLLGGTNGAEGFKAGNVRIAEFGTAIKYANNAWLTDFDHFAVLNSATTLDIPTGLSNTGENLGFRHGVFSDSAGYTNSVSIALGTADVRFESVSFDGIQFTQSAGIVSCTDCHFETSSATHQSTPPINITGGFISLTSPSFAWGATAGDAPTEFMSVSGSAQATVLGVKGYTGQAIAQMIAARNTATVYEYGTLSISGFTTGIAKFDTATFTTISPTQAAEIKTGLTVRGALNVDDTTQLGNLVKRSTSVTSGGLLTSRFDDNAAQYPVKVSNSDGAGANQGSGIKFQSGTADGGTPIDSGSIAALTEQGWTATASTRDSYIALSTALDGALGEQMRITSGGNVGIGNTPAMKLDVSGAIRSTMTVVTFSATPTFDASLGNSFKITLTDNITSSTFSNAQAGQQISFLICQDATGNRTFVWPTNVKGGVTIGATLSTCSAQTFLYDGTNAYAVSSGVTRM
ncbi:MAG: hypothetical protein HYS38_10195 [Acidobacteria bacterium]|nr:hypothetical protein [Acidobacteriota bacterium]